MKAESIVWDGGDGPRPAASNGSCVWSLVNKDNFLLAS